MKNLGKITDPKDIITKEFLEEGIGTRVNTLEDNVAMAESDIETLQGDVQSLQTDNTATKAAVKTLQDTYVPNTRKVNNQSLDADITLTASDVGAPREEVDGNGFPIVSTTAGDVIWNYDTDNGNAVLGQTPTNEGRDGYVQTIYGKNGVNTTLGQYGVKLQNTDGTTYIEVGSSVSSGKNIVEQTSQNILLNASKVYVNTTTGASGGTITNLANPTNNLDATNKQYVDNLKPTTHQNVTVPTSAWVANTNSQAADQEKTDYPFMATISLTGVSANQMATVLFNYDDQIGGNFAPCAYTTSGGVIIEAKEKPTATITLASVTIMNVDVK